MQAMTTPGGLLLVLAVLIPFIGVLAGMVLGERGARRVAFATLAAGLAVAVGIAAALAGSGDTVVYVLGGWTPPLGVALRADGLARRMADPQSCPPAAAVIRLVWAGLVAGSIGILFSMLVMIIETAHLLFSSWRPLRAGFR